MVRVYKPYWVWEDYKNGMWRKVDKNTEIVLLDMAIKFTGNHVLYGNAMSQVASSWKNTMLNSLTNTSINRRAFLGHCACQYKINCPEYVTRMAWRELTDKQRRLADLVAQKTIDKWEINYKNTLKLGRKGATKVGYQMSLQLE